MFIFLIVPIAEARSGCCSWHEGVRGDGCGCNDGTPLSSTCAPYYSCTANQPIEEESLYIAPTTVPTAIPTRVWPTFTPYPTRKPLPIRTPPITMTPSPTSTPSPTMKPKPVKKIILPTPLPERHWWDWLFGRQF